jgi:elongator complex protein 1
LLEQHLYPAAKAAGETMLSNLAEVKSDIQLRVARLVECRKEKKSKMDQFFAKECEFDGPGLENIDVLSDSTSLMSTFTGITLASSRASGVSTSSRKSQCVMFISFVCASVFLTIQIT